MMRHHYNITIRFFLNPKDWTFHFTLGGIQGYGIKLFVIALLLEHWEEMQASDIPFPFEEAEKFNEENK